MEKLRSASAECKHECTSKHTLSLSKLRNIWLDAVPKHCKVEWDTPRHLNSRLAKPNFKMQWIVQKSMSFNRTLLPDDYTDVSFFSVLQFWAKLWFFLILRFTSILQSCPDTVFKTHFHGVKSHSEYPNCPNQLLCLQRVNIFFFKPTVLMDHSIF